jgi:hypothetical protein
MAKGCHALPVAWRTLLDAALSELPSECTRDRQRATHFEISSNRFFFPISAPGLPQAAALRGHIPAMHRREAQRRVLLSGSG